MREEIEKLARHRMSRAREAFGEGECLLAQCAPIGAVNRFYYCAFYAARSLLATRGVDSARHSGVISLFQEHFVRTGMLPLDVAKALPRAFEKRQKSDYGDFATVSLDEARRVADEVRVFFDECRTVLDKIIAEES